LIGVTRLLAPLLNDSLNEAVAVGPRRKATDAFMVTSLHVYNSLSNTFHDTTYTIDDLNRSESLETRRNLALLTFVLAGGVIFCSIKEAILIFEGSSAKLIDNSSKILESLFSISSRSVLALPMNLEVPIVATLAMFAMTEGKPTSFDPRCGVPRKMIPVHEVWISW
jgi:hypothetical protein